MIPRKARYVPEMWFRATTIASLDVEKSFTVLEFTRPNFGPFACWLRQMAAARLDGMKLYVTADERERVIEVDAGSRVTLDRAIDLSILTTRRLRVNVLNKTGALVTNYPVRLAYSIDHPPAVERVPPVFDPYTLKLIEMVEISERVTVKAGKEERVGPPISIPVGQFCTIFEIACERSVKVGDPKIKVIRDGEDVELDIDCYAMPDLEFGQRCWIPATETMEVKLASSGGVTNYRVRYRYCFARMVPELVKLWALPVPVVPPR